MTNTGAVAMPPQRVTFVELFFDLVFVFAVTQVVKLVHHDLNWTGVGKALLVFWLVFWAWTQFTWALNSAETRKPWVQLSVLLATAIAFLMAVTLPDAFTHHGAWFALLYVAVRIVGLGVYVMIAQQDSLQRAAVRRFALFSLSGLAAVSIGGVAPDDMRVWWWTAAVALDLLVVATVVKVEGWGIRADHFAERHGLFVIIALGESLIVAAAGLSETEYSARTIAVGILAVAATCGLWWTYFSATHPVLEHELSAHQGLARSLMARDIGVFHFPLIFGIVLFAVAIEEAVLHPADPLPHNATYILIAGITLFLGASGLVLLRAGERRIGSRFGLVGLIAAALIVLRNTEVAWPLAIIVLAVAIVATLEQRARLHPSAS